MKNTTTYFWTLFLAAIRIMFAIFGPACGGILLMMDTRCTGTPIIVHIDETVTIGLGKIWGKFVDDVTGFSYLVNSVTGETCWESPEGGEANELVPPAVAMNLSWEEYVDDVTGRSYVVNPLTGESCWKESDMEGYNQVF